jgi:predicted translin family RNA/ssDNA-binding protein
MKEYINGEKSLSEMTDDELKEFSQMAKNLANECRKATSEMIRENKQNSFTQEEVEIEKKLNKLKKLWRKK